RSCNVATCLTTMRERSFNTSSAHVVNSTPVRLGLDQPLDMVRPRLHRLRHERVDLRLLDTVLAHCSLHAFENGVGVAILADEFDLDVWIFRIGARALFSHWSDPPAVHRWSGPR